MSVCSPDPKPSWRSVRIVIQTNWIHATSRSRHRLLLRNNPPVPVGRYVFELEKVMLKRFSIDLNPAPPESKVEDKEAEARCARITARDSRCQGRAVVMLFPLSSSQTSGRAEGEQQSGHCGTQNRGQQGGYCSPGSQSRRRQGRSSSLVQTRRWQGRSSSPVQTRWRQDGRR